MSDSILVVVNVLRAAALKYQTN